MWNGYQPHRSGIRFFPHIVPIAFPLIFPIGFGIALGLFHALFNVIGFLLFVALIFFIVRAIMLRSPSAAWNSMLNTGNQWRQRFIWQQQPPYYRPQQQQQPYYQPSSQAEREQPYGQGYQAPEQPYYRPTAQSNDYEQPRPEYPEQMPPMQG
jgi:hypothetical protein